MTSLVDAVRSAAVERPDDIAFTFLDDGEHVTSACSNLDVARGAAGIARGLQRHGIAGRPVVIAVRPGDDLPRLLVGCLSVGSPVVPVLPPSGGDVSERMSRLGMIASDLNAGAVVVDRGSDARLPVDEECRVFRADDDAFEAVDDLDLLDVAEPSSTAFVQFTSGSTRRPRGVVVTHRALERNLGTIASACALTSTDIGVMWVPPTHDMGLVGGFLIALSVGCRYVYMPPLAFLRRPDRWLRAISTHRGTVAGAPDFGYRLCVDRQPRADVDLDLSSWRIAFTGGEPIRPATLRDFVAAYADSGFDADSVFPIYGLAESTLMVTAKTERCRPVVRTFSRSGLAEGIGRASDEGLEDARELVSVGASPDPDADVRIVDPETSATLPDTRIGEVWVASDSIASSYATDAEASEGVFGVGPCDSSSERRYLRTGDLGFMYDGELFITSRLKDVLIIHGRNIDPADVEETVRDAAGRFVLCAAVQDEDGNLVVVAEGAGDLDQLVVRRAISARHGIRLRRLVQVRRGGLPKTPSGKLRRRAVAASIEDLAAGRITTRTAA